MELVRRVRREGGREGRGKEREEGGGEEGRGERSGGTSLTNIHTLFESPLL